MPDFLPRRDASLLTWSSNFSRRIGESYDELGLSAQQATKFAELQADFAAKYTATQNRASSTLSMIIAKTDAAVALKADARNLVRLIRVLTQVSSQQLINLGLKPETGGQTRIGRPRFAPEITLQPTIGRTIRGRLRTSDAPTSKAVPKNMAGAMLFRYVGDDPPASQEQWQWAGNASRTRFTLPFSATLTPGTKVWLTAVWINKKLQHGPPATPVYTHLGHAGPAVLTAQDKSTLRLAA